MSYIVKIELQRVQTFLFAVPRLADIVGANSLLGEVLRYRLTKLAQNHHCQKPAGLPVNLSGSIAGDPLAFAPSHKHTENLVEDNPQQLWGMGILARDGGHFRAHFANVADAVSFQHAAKNLLREQLPGLRCDIECLTVDEFLHAGNVSSPKVLPPAIASTLLSLPVLQQCQESGNGPASYLQRYKRDSREDEQRAINLAANQRKQQWRKFKDNKTADIAAIINRQLKLPALESFDALCDTDYLALIHADGNGLGKAMKTATHGQLGLAGEAAIENFFQAMRVTLRRAVKQAVEQFPEGQRSGIQILMLGGDDLLIACRAPLALPLAKQLAKALYGLQKQGDSPYPELTLGIGVAIAKPVFPFHKLHDLAEELAASAKRLVRGMEKPVSVVDWTVCSEAWYGELHDIRRATLFRHYRADSQEETLALSAKPYRVLDDGQHPFTPSLAALLDKQAIVSKKAGGDSARSQLRELVRTLRKGRRQADSAFLDLQIASPDTWQALNAAGFDGSLWKPLPNRQWLTPFADLVEIAEIAHLQTEASQHQTMADEPKSAVAN